MRLSWPSAPGGSMQDRVLVSAHGAKSRSITSRVCAHRLMQPQTIGASM